MKRSEYEAKLENLNKQIEELKNVEIEEDGVWKPKLEEKYWYINNDNLPYKKTWVDTYVDNCSFDIGNVFKTQEEAEFEAERLKVYRKLRWFSIKSKKDSKRFSIYYDYLSNEIKCVQTNNDYTKYAELLFETEECAVKAVETVGAEKVLKYYLEV